MCMRVALQHLAAAVLLVLAVVPAYSQDGPLRLAGGTPGGLRTSVTAAWGTFHIMIENPGLTRVWPACSSCTPIATTCSTAATSGSRPGRPCPVGCPSAPRLPRALPTAA